MLFTCVITNLGDKSLLWKKVSKNRGPDTLLTAGLEVVSSDERVGILHEEGGSVYVLQIKNLTVHDAGWCLCLSVSPD